MLDGCQDLSLDDQIITLVQSVESTSEDEANWELIIHSLQSWLSPSYPDIRLFRFGSAASGLGFYNSDLDVYMDFPNSESSNLHISFH